MIYRADLNGDTLLDKKELALWLHKNEQANKAAEIKGEFWVSFTILCAVIANLLYKLVNLRPTSRK